MINIVFFSVAAITFTAAAYKARGLRHDNPPPGLRALCLLLTTLGLAFILLCDAAQSIENRIYPNLGRLLSNLCTMLAALEIVAQLVSVSHPPEQAKPTIRRHVLLFALCATAMTVLFLSSPLPATIGDFGSVYHDRPALVVYNLLFVLGLGTAMINLLGVTVKYTRHAGITLRIGLHTVGLGSVVILAYLAEKTIFVVSQWAGLRPLLAGHDRPCPSALTPAGCVFAVGFPVLGMLLISIGMTLPAWGPRASAPMNWIRHWWLGRRLRPLWEVLHEAYPDTALPSPGPIGPRWRLHRQVIEIRDGLLALQPYQDPQVRDAAETAAKRAGMSGPRLQAVIEATVVAAALATRNGRTRIGDGAMLSSMPGQISRPASLTSEAAWLVMVANALTSPLVRQQIALLEHEDLIENPPSAR